MGIHYSDDAGNTWSPLPGAEEIDREFTIFIDETTGGLYMGKDDGLYLYSNPVSVLEDDNIYIPQNYLLYQNYPNPFNPETRISYDLPDMSFVSIIIYDQLGREVKRLVETEQQPGFYTVTLSSHNLASGVYYYQLRAGTHVDTKKMVIIR